MKKYIILALLLTPFSVFAVSGTCSSHGGVDCSIGPDWDSSAICKDGWAASGERYFDQIVCSQTPMCTQYEWGQMSDTQVMIDDRAHFSDLINQINTLNIEYPMIEIRLQQSYIGRGVTRASADIEIAGAQRTNRNAVTKSTYEAILLDQKLRSAQFEINRACIAPVLALKKAEDSARQLKLKQEQSALQNSLQVLKADTLINASEYRNVRNLKIYRDVRLRYATNESLGCGGLLFIGEDLAMCQAFALDKNKDRWATIDRPEPELVTSESLLAKKQQQESNQKIAIQNIVPENKEVVLKSDSKIELKKELSKKNQIIVNKAPTTTPLVKLNISTTTTVSSTSPKINTPIKQSITKRISLWFKSWFK